MEQPNVVLLPAFAEERDGHQRESEDSHCGADWEVYAEIQITHNQTCHQQKAHTHCRRDKIVLADVVRLADDTAEVRHSQGDEPNRAADANRTGNQKHNHQQTHRLVDIGELNFPAVVPGQVAGAVKRSANADGKEHEGKDDVPGRNAFEIEIGRSPEVIFLHKFRGGRIGHHYGAKRAYEGAEEYAESDKVARGNLQGHEKADEGADQGADKTTHRQRTPSAHRSGCGSKTGGAAQPQRIHIAELVAPQILHLNASYRQGYAT